LRLGAGYRAPAYDPRVTVWNAPQLVYEYNGPNSKDGWKIFDAGDQAVATVDTPGFFNMGELTYTMLDLGGQPVLRVIYLNPGVIARSGVPLVVAHPNGNEWGRFVPPALNRYKETVFDVVANGASVGRFTATHELRGPGAGLTDAAGTEVAKVGQGKKRMGFFKQ
jgi:hypothetical protein